MSLLKLLNSEISKGDKEGLMNQKSKVIWFTGLSGAGKTTLSTRLEEELFARGFKTCLLDGDKIRSGLSNDLAFSDGDRTENIRRIGEVAKLILDSGIIVICAFITPFEKDRKWLKLKIEPDNFLEVYVACPFSVCEKRDVKGLYQLSKQKRIKNLTGAGSVYEAPIHPDLILNTDLLNVEDCINQLLSFVLPFLRLH